MEKLVNAIGKACPIPVVEAKKAAGEFTENGVLTVLVDNEIAVSNLRKLADKSGYSVTSEKRADKEYAVVMNVVVGQKAAEPVAEAVEEVEKCVECQGDSIEKGLIVVLSSNQMGTGAEQLGKNLMKAFIFAVSKQDKLPETILCYNSGASLTCEDSLSLQDLKDMVNEGVRIATCGTCLDFYGLKEKLAVGSVTNMYDIVETMEAAKKVVRP
ncbi:MAG: sulfurtransferase-like selenium metabolism protein YedF [Dorea sp.]|nr:sulfurtransferase-like selenium metabolism protein YedF [Dorea sp.]